MVKTFPVLANNMDVFRCPICGDKMDIEGSKRIFCSRGHSFDLSGKGYVNLLSRQSKTGYNKEMFTARRYVAEAGYFEPLLRSVSDGALEYIAGINSRQVRILDVGCGEGSQLVQLTLDLALNSGREILGVGMDISKEAIQMAARNQANMIWCVANLAAMPLADRRFQLLLNILSPANYAEFDRVLADEGLLIKVLPGDDHLRELREILYPEPKEQSYSDRSVRELFNSNFTNVKSQKICYTVRPAGMAAEYFPEMTPLIWGADKEIARKLLSKKISEITMDFTALFGRK